MFTKPAAGIFAAGLTLGVQRGNYINRNDSGDPSLETPPIAGGVSAAPGIVEQPTSTLHGSRVHGASPLSSSQPTQVVPSFKGLTARDAIKWRLVQDLMQLVSPVGRSVKEGSYHVSASDYCRALLEAKDIYDMMRTMLRLQPEVIYYIGDVEGTPEETKASEFEKVKVFPSFRVHKIMPERAIEYDKLAVTYWTVLSLIQRNVEFLKMGIAPLSEAELEKFRENFITMLGPDPAGQFEFNPEKLRAFMVHMAIHDLGKVTAFKLAYEGLTESLVVNHDQLLTDAMSEGLDFLLPTYGLLTPQSKVLVDKALKAAAKINIPQVIQGEAGVAMLASMEGLTEEEVEFFVYHVMFDTYGSKGFQAIAPLLLAKFLHPVFEKALPHIKAASQGNSGFNPFVAYESIVKSNLGASGQHLNFSDPADFTRARLFAHLPTRLGKMKSLSVEGKIAAMSKAFDDMSGPLKEALIRSYSANGINDGQLARIFQYGPSLIENAAYYYQNEQGLPEIEALERACEDCLAFFARVSLELEAKLKGKEQKGSIMVLLQSPADALLPKDTGDGGKSYRHVPSDLHDDIQFVLEPSSDGFNVKVV